MVKLVVKLMVMIHVFDSWGSQSWRRPNLKTKFRGVLKFEVSQTFRQRTPQKKQIVHSCREPGYSDHTRFSRSSHTDDPNGSSSKSYDIFTSRGEVLEEKQQDGSAWFTSGSHGRSSDRPRSLQHRGDSRARRSRGSVELLGVMGLNMIEHV